MAITVRGVERVVQQRQLVDAGIQAAAAVYHDDLLELACDLTSRPELLAIVLDELIGEVAQTRHMHPVLVDGDAKAGPYRA